MSLRRRRLRNLEDRPESRILPLFVRRSREVGNMLLERCLHRWAEGDCHLALRGPLGAEMPSWNAPRLDDLKVVYL